jgi:hypothetical protein
MSEDNSRILRPTNLDVNKFRRSQTNTPDQFGQQYNADSDPSKLSPESPQESRRSHLRADTDVGPRSLHHTLGIKSGQASPGNHDHTGITGKKIGPLEMDPSNLGKTRAEWTIPVAPSVADLVTLLSKFVNFRQV